MEVVGFRAGSPSSGSNPRWNYPGYWWESTLLLLNVNKYGLCIRRRQICLYTFTHNMVVIQMVRVNTGGIIFS